MCTRRQYAALPHLLRLQRAAAEPSWSAIALIAAIEIARANGRGPAIPDDLAEAYHAALRALHGALPKSLNPQSSELLMRAVLAAVAAAASQPVTAEAILDLTPELARRFLDEWRDEELVPKAQPLCVAIRWDPRVYNYGS